MQRVDPEQFRILIVEDEPVVAMDLESVIRAEGFALAGVVSSNGQALAFIQKHEVHFAILDANLRGESSRLVASALRKQNIPFLVLSGYAENQLSEEFRAGTYLPKPFNTRQMLHVLESARVSVRQTTAS